MTTKVLIAVDGGFRFADGATPAGILDFTVTILVDTLVAAGMDVTKANRSADDTATMGWDSFHFDALPAGHTLDEFDAIWMIGDEGISAEGLGGTTGALPDTELTAIANYMDNQGGVFATGDHYSLGAEMCGKIPRVRAMRCWYGSADSAASHLPPAFPRNFPPLTSNRADTTQPNPASDYSEFPAPFIWFENQSDTLPQPIVPIAPTHPILRYGDADVVVYPDHMHEGQTLGEVLGYDYSQNSPYGDTTKAEFREDNLSHRELPKVIATGQVLGNASRRASSPAGEFSFGGIGLPGADAIATPKTVNTLSVYDGRVAGVGRVVTGSTFHHYIDINLNGDSSVTTAQAMMRATATAQDGHGFNDNPAVLNTIKAVYVNITNWIARPRPVMQLILERSTFSQDEAPSGTEFAEAILVTIDGLKPSQFPGSPPVPGAIIGPVPWAPIVTVAGAPIVIEPTFVASDDPSQSDRVQRFTFKFRLRFSGNAFGFPEDVQNVVVDASLSPTMTSTSLTDSAFIQLVKSANPFMLDLADGNETNWLSSDVKVFHVVEGESAPGIGGASLPMGASRTDALNFIRSLANTITSAQFSTLSGSQATSALSPFPQTTMTGRRVYNFALARVRLNSSVADANDVRMFFRIFTTQTTAALTYRESSPGVPIEGYVQTAGVSPIALPGKVASGSEWISFPCFASGRDAMPSAQNDTANVKDILASESFKFFGALLDNNLDDPYPGLIPGAMIQPSLRSLLNGVHQCLVAQIEYASTPIPNGSTPWTSDKLSQRNIAFLPVANPGLDASRTASHTFEIEATPNPVSPSLWPDELMLDWSEPTPAGTMLRIYIPGWNARKVAELSEQLYARNEIEAIDEHTIEMSAGGIRYIPIPQSLHRQIGVISVEFPLGIKKGQRFDVSVRQISTRGRGPKPLQPKLQQISLAEAHRLIADLPDNMASSDDVTKPGIFNLGKNRVLMTDLSAFELANEHGVIIEYPDATADEKVRAASRTWRETIGAFQLGMPVSTKKDMLLDQMRILSVMQWRLALVQRKSPWRKVLQHYVELLAAKVQALGGNPFDVPATPDGVIPQLPWSGGEGAPCDNIPPEPNKPFARGLLFGFLIALVLLLILLLYRW
ncbi:hypothetical protein [Shewanella salipaludis]|uniref:Uncharacterized protein n=1 Tax=Shewanella salipaludis TaxID=2723052 RepID=A0A972JI36_9GAMM|nr:hypothetical protein [Shewanella salipaludis]NMH63770.1 hypothetical protein [Shewanella salipaludis]